MGGFLFWQSLLCNSRTVDIESFLSVSNEINSVKNIMLNTLKEIPY